MTEHSSKQIVNFSYLDKEAELYKESKQSLNTNVKEIQEAIDNNTKDELKQVQTAVDNLNKKVERIMETKYIKERKQNVEDAQKQMMKSIKEASNTFFQVREVIRGKDNLSAEEKRQYEEKLFHKILDKFMSKEEKEVFTRIISAGPLLMLGGGSGGSSGGGGSMGGGGMQMLGL
jgi:phosphoenolpyruvate-protein kinase (PTS system EI component)